MLSVQMFKSVEGLDYTNDSSMTDMYYTTLSSISIRRRALRRLYSSVFSLEYINKV